MELTEYEYLREILNAKLLKHGYAEKFAVTTQRLNGEVYYFLTLKNPVSDELSIELGYDGEWTVYFLGIHDHLYDDEYYESGEIFADAVLKRYIIPILENRIVHVCFVEDGKWCGSSIEVVPENIPFEFTENELPNPKTCHVVNWNGEVKEPKIRAYAVSERKEVESLRENSFAELLD